MNSFKLCKKVFKYDKKVFSVDCNELRGCLKYNFDGFKVGSKNKLLCVGNDIKTGFNKLDKTDKNILIYGILGVIGGYIYCLVTMGNSKINEGDVACIIFISTSSGLLCALVGVLLPPVFPVGVCIMGLPLLGYGPIWMHNKRLETKN